MSDIHAAFVDADGELAGEASQAIVPWWSFTKTLIAACLLRLSEQDRLALDEPLEGVPYTARDVMRHRAGIGDYGSLTDYHDAVARDDDPWPDETILARIPPDRLLFAPGARFAYSNVGYLILRRRIEAICDAPSSAVLKAEVLDPLGLRIARIALTRADMRDTAFAAGRSYHPGWVYHGLVIGPAAEAALALHRLLDGDLLAPASRAALMEGVPIGEPVDRKPWLTAAYGLGLMTGAMQRQGMAQPLLVAGHSAGGPGSVGAVYHALDGDGRHRTAAVFMAAPEEGAAEDEALRLLVEGAAA
jgi:CubicO group peptidase (beta-lactamase class C family)